MKKLSFLLLAVLLIGCGGSGGDDAGDAGDFSIMSISGRATLNGTGLSGVTIALKGLSGLDAGKSETTTTDVSGNYTFTGLVVSRKELGNYTITPSKTGFVFSPSGGAIGLGADAKDTTMVTFIATPAPFSISGQVTLNGTGLSGVDMTLNGDKYATTTTDVSGNYTFTDVANGSYTIRSYKEGFTFSPTSSQQTVSGANITAVNFAATTGPFSISGQVTWNGTGLSGVDMTLNGDKYATTTTDVSGNYTFTGLVNGSYTITPSRTGFTFSPTSSQQTVSVANITAVNFTVASEPSALIVPCPPTSTTNVSVQDNVFTPQDVTISLNGIVRWIFNGPSLHIVLSGTFPTLDNNFNIGSRAIGQSACVQFYETGTYPYFCPDHPNMNGRVVVQ